MKTSPLIVCTEGRSGWLRLHSAGRRIYDTANTSQPHAFEFTLLVARSVERLHASEPVTWLVALFEVCV